MFKDFAAWDVGLSADPQVSYTRKGATVTSGNVGAYATRPYVSFVPDRDAKYLSVGARVLAMNQATGGSEHLQSQHFTKWQLESKNLSEVPGVYSPAREVQLVVRPDRLNSTFNPSFEVDPAFAWSPSNATHLRVNTQASAGLWSMQLTSTGTFDMGIASSAFAIIWVVPGESYSVQAKFRAATTPRNVRLTIFWSDVLGGSHGQSDGVAVPNTTTGWTRAVLENAVAPVGAVRALMVATVLSPGAAGEVHYVDDVMFEDGIHAGEYFDGDTDGDDYIWENLQPDHNSRSYYYENRLDRSETIRRALRDVAPMGIGIGEAQFGIFTG